MDVLSASTSALLVPRENAKEVVVVDSAVAVAVVVLVEVAVVAVASVVVAAVVVLPAPTLPTVVVSESSLARRSLSIKCF